MKTIQMTLDDELVKAVDYVAKRLHTNRSAFTRKALRDALTKLNITQLENKHRKGYEFHPAGPSEFSVWEKEQKWGDA
jgi:metal-responsive CopG/Arc/MetJ family transcriptional regulator